MPYAVLLLRVSDAGLLVKTAEVHVEDHTTEVETIFINRVDAHPKAAGAGHRIMSCYHLSRLYRLHRQTAREYITAPLGRPKARQQLADISILL
jgi:uracil-DNA glycosylase